MKKDWIVRALLGFVLAMGVTMLILLCLMSGGCSRKVYLPVEAVRTEYREADTTGIFNRIWSMFESRREKEKTSDSLIDRTKEIIVLKENGDTAIHYKDRYVRDSSRHEMELEHEIADRDSIIKDLRTALSSVKVDSIAVPYPVEKKLTKWQQAKMDVGGIAMGALAVVICVVIIWLIRKGRR